MRNIKQLSRRSTRNSGTKLSTTSTNNINNVNEISTRSTSSATIPPPATSTGSKKRRSVKLHFHKISKICDNDGIKKKKKSRFQLGSDSDSSSESNSDSEYVDKVVKEESFSMDTNVGHSTVADVQNAVTQKNTNIRKKNWMKWTSVCSSTMEV